MTTGTVRFVRRKWPGNGFGIGRMAASARDPTVVGAIERTDVRIGHHRRPRRCAMACIATASGNEMAAIHAGRQIAVVASRTGTSYHVVM